MIGELAILKKKAKALYKKATRPIADHLSCGMALEEYINGNSREPFVKQFNQVWKRIKELDP
ncbi:MAG: hypothetical protein PHX80_03615, partial [Candidatus Nanoarchaeia archaeon]|nr:hypothetical protein [Candidatus Nanoarchaeia archaeon]